MISGITLLMRKFIVGFTTIFLVLLAIDAIPALRGGFGWRWRYAAPDTFLPVLWLALALVVYLGGVIWLRRPKVPVWISLLFGILAGLLLCLAALNVRGDLLFLLFTRTVSPVQTGASTIAVRNMAGNGFNQTVQNWTEVMEESGELNIIHFTTSPPGQPLLHYWTADFLDKIEGVSRPLSQEMRTYQCSDLEVMRYSRGEIAGVGLGMLMPLWASLMVIPVYCATQTLTGEPQLARRAAHWSPLVPALLLFTPTWNTLYPFLGSAAFALLAAGIKSRRVNLVIAGGIVMSGATFLNFSVLPILLLCGLYTLAYWFFIARQESPSVRWYWTIQIGAWFGLGLSFTWFIFWLYAGYTPLEIFQVALDQHRTLVKRNYWVWIGMHLYDTFLFIGFPLVFLALATAMQTLQKIKAQRDIVASDVLAGVLFVTILALALSGSVQGENGRILMFYAPFLIMVSAPFWARSALWDMPVMVMQAGTVLVMGAVLVVVPLDLNPQVTAPRTDIPAFDSLEWRTVHTDFSSAQYAGRFRLERYRFIADPAQQAITVELQWAGDERTERPYQFQIIAYAENEIDGAIESMPYTWYPQNGNYLTPCWRNGDIIREVIIVPLPPVSMPVVWRLELRAIDERTKDFAGVASLGPINYP